MEAVVEVAAMEAVVERTAVEAMAAMEATPTDLMVVELLVEVGDGMVFLTDGMRILILTTTNTPYTRCPVS